jgi:5-methylcytosine-specific restriction endonuclease McrA
MARSRASSAEMDQLEWWKGKLLRMADRTFAMPERGHQILDLLCQSEGCRVEARSFKELAARLNVPLKFVPRAVASLTRLGIVTAVLRPPDVSIVLHRDRLRRRKIGLHRKRVRLSEWERERLKAESDYRCACCGESSLAQDLVLDHLIPLSLLGADHPANLVVMKKSHNADKWDRFVRAGLKFYRREQVTRRFGVRFIDGAFWPIINGRLRR